MSELNLTSDLTELIVVANAGNSSFVVQTDQVPALFVDHRAKIGINTLTPGSQLEVASTNGSCIRARYGSNIVDLSLNSSGDTIINPSATGSQIILNKSVDIPNHNGSTAGLKLGGVLVRVSADEFNAISTTPGVAEASKVILLDDNKSIHGLTAVSASEIAGTLQTAAQPNITSVGTLTSLTVSGPVNITTLNGTLQTPHQPNITSIGTLPSLNVTAAINAGTVIASNISVANNIVANNVTGTIITAAQPNITSVGVLSSLTVTGAFAASELTGTLKTPIQSSITRVGTLAGLTVSGLVEITGTLIVNGVEVSGSGGSSGGARTPPYCLNITPGTAELSKALVLNGSGEISGINSLSAATLSGTTLSGTIATAAQPNITSVGTLSELTVSNGLVANQLTGTVMTAAQPYITSLNSLTVATNITASTISGTLTGGPQTGITRVGTLNQLTVTNGIVANELTGTLQTGAQPNITSVGTLGSLTVMNGITATNVTGTLQTGAQPNITSVGTLGSLTVTNGIAANELTGTLQTGAQPNITSVGTLGSLTVTNGIAASELTGTLATGAQPNITSVGTLGSLTVTNGIAASELTGTLQTGAQPNITSVGTLGSLTVTNGIAASELTGTLQTGAQPNITSVGTLGSLTVTNGIAASELTGTLATGAQPNITSVGTLGSLAVTNGITASELTGTLQTGDQPNITSVGTLGSLTIGTGVLDAGAAKLDVLATSGSCLRLRRDTQTYVDLSVGTGGDLNMNRNLFIGNGTTTGGGTNLTWVNMSGINIDTSAWNDVCWGVQVNRFVAVGDANAVMYSANGIAWTVGTPVAALSSNNWRAVVWASALSRFVAIGEGATTRFMYSSDGITWTAGTAGSGTTSATTWRNLSWSPEKNVLVAVSTTANTSNIMWSSNGQTWNYVSAPNATVGYGAVCWSSKYAMFLMVAYGGTATATSTDGITWVAGTNMTSSLNYSTIAWSEDLSLFVLGVGNSSTYAYSQNGVQWTYGTLPNSTLPNSIRYFPEAKLFACVASSGTYRIHLSADGTNWKYQTVPTNASTWTSITWSPQLSRFVAVRSAGTNRTMWANYSMPTMYVATGANKVLRLQYDAATYSDIQSTSTGALGIRSGLKLINPYQTSTTDTIGAPTSTSIGFTSSATSPIPSDSMVSSVWVPSYSRFVGVTSYCDIYVSADGITWTKQTTLPTYSYLVFTPLLMQVHSDGTITIAGRNSSAYYSTGYGDNVTDGIFFSTNGGASWSTASVPTIFSVTGSYANCKYIYYSGTSWYLFITSYNLSSTMIYQRPNNINNHSSNINITISSTENFSCAVYANGYIFMIGVESSSATSRVLYTPLSFATLTAATTASNFRYPTPYNIAYSSYLGVIVVVGNYVVTGNSAIMYNTNQGTGTYYMASSSAIINVPMRYVYWLPEYYVFMAVSDTGNVFISPNGWDWDLYFTNPNTVSGGTRRAAYSSTLKKVVMFQQNNSMLYYLYNNAPGTTIPGTLTPERSADLSVDTNGSLTLLGYNSNTATIIKSASTRSFSSTRVATDYDLLINNANETTGGNAGIAFTTIGGSLNSYTPTATICSYQTGAVGYGDLIFSTRSGTSALSACSERMRITGSGTILRANNGSSFDTTSDMRVKQNIVLADTNICYNVVKHLKLKYYQYIDSVQAQIDSENVHLLGWIAQEVQEHFPKAVSVSNRYGLEDCLTINQEDIFKSLYGAVAKIIEDKEATESKVVELESQISSQQTIIANLLSQMSALMQRVATLESK